mgnify:FL=1
MERMLREGDYVPDGRGGVQTVEGARELLERVLWKLCVRRGSFPLLPELGSQLWRLSGVKSSQRQALARQYVAEALSDEEGHTIIDVRLTAEGGDGTRRVELEWRGESLAVETAV